MATILVLVKLDLKPDDAAGPPWGPSYLRMMPMQRRVPKARLPPATRNVGSGTEVESCTKKKKKSKRERKKRRKRSRGKKGEKKTNHSAGAVKTSKEPHRWRRKQCLPA